MDFTWDEGKWRRTLKERGLDFADCAQVFAGPTFTYKDNRKDYGELRYITYGVLKQDLVVVVHTERGDSTRIISMRKANGREKAKFAKYCGV